MALVHFIIGGVVLATLLIVGTIQINRFIENKLPYIVAYQSKSFSTSSMVKK